MFGIVLNNLGFMPSLRTVRLWYKMCPIEACVGCLVPSSRRYLEGSEDLRRSGHAGGSSAWRLAFEGDTWFLVPSALCFLFSVRRGPYHMLLPRLHPALPPVQNRQNQRLKPPNPCAAISPLVVSVRQPYHPVVIKPA